MMPFFIKLDTSIRVEVLVTATSTVDYIEAIGTFQTPGEFYLDNFVNIF